MAFEYPQDDAATLRLAPERLNHLRRRLTTWYRRRARDLPWRATRDPYAIWVSEIMLQQTQVEAVIPYYERFLSAFPTVDALAGATEQSVLRLWEGLGYYRRARNLHRAARMVVSRHGGRLPQDPELLRALPGVGRYTAGAILSIAFGRREPILEANSRRVLARLFARRGDPARQPLEGELWSLARALLPRRNPGRFNQALMELGAQICLPRRPQCTECPIERICMARQQGVVHELPSSGAKPPIEHVCEAAVVIRRGTHVLVIRRPHGARWEGMFDFPRASLDTAKKGQLPRALAARVHAQTGVRIDAPRRIGQIRHSVTRFRITLHCYVATAPDTEARASPSRARPATQQRSATRKADDDPVDLRWVTPRQLRKLPMPVPARRLAELVFGQA